MRWLERYSRKQLMKKVAATKRVVRIVPLDHVKKVGILWHENDSRAFTYLQEQFRSRSTIVRQLCFSDTGNSTDSNVLTKKDFNWLGFPVSGTIETFIATEFEMLINLSTHSCTPLEVITALSAASFKIGWDQGKMHLYDMSIDVSLQPDAYYLAEQTMIYLQKFAR